MKDGYIFMGQHWRDLFHRVEFYYHPVRIECWALLSRGRIRYFTELQAMLDYAAAAKLIKPGTLPTIRINLAQAEADIDSKSFSDRWENPEASMQSFRITR